MAQRRMFAKTIINSAQFIKMPPSSQMLYFHLGMNADDDGVVEAFTIMRMVGASEDDLKILAVKKFITVLNEDLVTFINNWLDHNIIRPDRKIDSKYKDLLIQIMSDGVELVERKPRGDTISGQQEISGLSMDGEMSAQVRLGKVRLGQDNKKKIIKEKEINPHFEEIKKNYPHGAGGTDWVEARKKFDDRIAQGDTGEEMLAGTLRYLKFCEVTGKVGTEFIKMPQTFLGIRKHYKLPWSLPRESTNQSKSKSTATRIFDDLEASYADAKSQGYI